MCSEPSVDVRSKSYSVFVYLNQSALDIVIVIARSLNCLRRRSNLVVYDGIAIRFAPRDDRFFPN